VRLRLFRNKPYEFPQYTIELIDERGRVVREISRLRPADADGALSVLLNPGDVERRQIQVAVCSANQGTTKSSLESMGCR